MPFDKMLGRSKLFSCDISRRPECILLLREWDNVFGIPPCEEGLGYTKPSTLQAWKTVAGFFFDMPYIIDIELDKIAENLHLKSLECPIGFAP